jgi:hypothetical protein
MFIKKKVVVVKMSRSIRSSFEGGLYFDEACAIAVGVREDCKKKGGYSIDEGVIITLHQQIQSLQNQVKELKIFKEDTVPLLCRYDIEEFMKDELVKRGISADKFDEIYEECFEFISKNIDDDIVTNEIQNWIDNELDGCYTLNEVKEE